MRIGPIPTMNKEFSLHTKERERTARLGLEHVCKYIEYPELCNAIQDSGLP